MTNHCDECGVQIDRGEECCAMVFNNHLTDTGSLRVSCVICDESWCRVMMGLARRRRERRWNEKPTAVTL